MSKKDKSDKDKGEKKNKGGKKKDAGAVSVPLTVLVTQLARTLRTRLSHNLADSGLYAGQDGVMQLLGEEDGITPGALAQRLGVKAPTMTRTIGRMEAQGFVMRRADDKDARLTKVYLTEEGRNSIERIAGAADDCERVATKGLSGKEVKVLARLLVTVEENLRNDPERR
ncbi:MarR family transcriptional regulator [Rhizobium daejeonense]|uniref:MarR family transcriptional regulator n=1 Tax=Rhizobium daejeonense TaxID=240521 RepID=A0A6M1RYY6_9HYPH|nr:MarR family transcriptional regulator [Rhizobium daejeonense]NGO62167.1 MarR family transcriptional regulator [Rhizobium daejeonense]